MAKLFCYRKPLNPYKMKTRNIFMIGNDFSRRFRRCRLRICNNLKVTKMKGGGGVFLSLTSTDPPILPKAFYLRFKVPLYFLIENLFITRPGNFVVADLALIGNQGVFQRGRPGIMPSPLFSPFCLLLFYHSPPTHSTPSPALIFSPF